MRRSRYFAFPTRAAAAGIGWWILTDGATDWSAWAVGLAGVIAAAALSVRLLPPTGWSWIGALRFARFFVRESWLGAVDVARRAMHPRIPIAPGIVRHELGESPDLARAIVASVATLLPGSLVVDVDSRGLTLHVLDRHGRALETVASTERHVAAMLRLPMPEQRRASESRAQ